MTSQGDLFGGSDLPDGFVYRPELVTAAQEQDLMARMTDLPFAPFQFHGFEGARRVVSFGWRYDFGAARIESAPPLPEWLKPLRDRAANLAGLAPEAFVHALVTEYAPGAPIGWHKDRPVFDRVVGVSLGSPCIFRFRRRRGAGWERASLTAEPRSAYLLSGPSRAEWEHSIPPVKALRWSVTFRSLRAASDPMLEDTLRS